MYTKLLNDMTYDLVRLVAARRGEYWEYLCGATQQQIKRAICSHPSLTLLAHGKYSVVASHRDYPDIVIKVSHCIYDSWLDYAEYAMQNQDDTHVLKVYGIKKYGGVMYVSIIEKLHSLIELTWSIDKTNGHSDIEYGEYIDEDHAYEINSIESCIEQLRNYTKPLELRRYLRNELEWSPITCRKYMRFLSSTIKMYNTLVSDDYDGPRMDFHEGNVMTRSDGTLVLSDPVH